MDTYYCDHCGLLHDHSEGECEGCKLTAELKISKDKLDKTVKFLENLAETHRYNGGDAITQFVKELKE